MKDYIPNRITGVLPGSIAEEVGLQPGDILLSVNGEPVVDIIDYKYLLTDEYLELEVQSGDEMLLVEIEKEYDEDLGLQFSNPLIQDAKSCRNNCIFCLSISCRKICVKPSTLRMMIPDCLFCRGISSH